MVDYSVLPAEMIPHIYEMALKRNPQNEELYSHLFMAYVRIGDYKKQQQVIWSPFPPTSPQSSGFEGLEV